MTQMTQKNRHEGGRPRSRQVRASERPVVRPLPAMTKVRRMNVGSARSAASIDQIRALTKRSEANAVRPCGLKPNDSQ